VKRYTQQVIQADRGTRPLNSGVIQFGSIMNISEINKLKERIGRLKLKADDPKGAGAEWTVEFAPDKNELRKISGVKTPEEIEDEVSTVFLWLWSLKDYVKKLCMAKGADDRWVENAVNSDSDLCVCADIANSLKHCGLDSKSRSNRCPKLGNVVYKIDSAELASFKFYESGVTIDPSEFNLIRLELPVFDDHGRLVGDAFQILKNGIEAWDKIIINAEKIV
jgi:hypothetical protein